MHRYTRATVVSNYCASFIVLAASSQLPQGAGLPGHHFHGPPNETRVLLGSDGPEIHFSPQSCESFFICCSGIFLLMELWIANQGKCSFLSLLQSAPAEHLPPGLAWWCLCCHLPLLFHTLSLFFKHCFSFLSLLFDLQEGVAGPEPC